jgi:hypothetical protein
MGDNDRSSDDPCESGRLEVCTEDNPLDCLQQFLRGLTEDRRQEDMLVLSLHLIDYTQEIAAAVVDVFQVCFSKGIQWKTLDVWLPADNNQNRFLHLILAEARRLRQFKEVELTSMLGRVALTNETAMELQAMMSSEQGLEKLSLPEFWLLPGVLSTLSQGLLANRVGALELDYLNEIVSEREIMVGRDGEMAYFIEVLQQNTSLQYLSLCRNYLSDETLSRVILALVGHPKLERLYLHKNDWSDQITQALCSLFDSDSCMLSELSIPSYRSSRPGNTNVGSLAEAIVGYGCLQILDLPDCSLDKHDLVTLLDAASRCRTLISLDVSDNDIGNLHLVDGIMQTNNPDPPSRLRTLNLRGNPLGEDDRAALAKLVEVHPELQDFGFDEDEESLLITPAIQYMLDLNRSGRVLMTNPSNTPRVLFTNPNTPLSVWATVLERANSLLEGETNSDVRTERQASVIFGLLQGPAFAARSPNE